MAFNAKDGNGVITPLGSTIVSGAHNLHRLLVLPDGASPWDLILGALRVTLAGNLIASEDSVSIGLALPPGDNIVGRVRIADQIGVFSAANSRTTSVAAGATFTGTAESALEYAAIGISCFFSQNGVLFIDRGSSSTNLDHVVSFPTTANIAFVTTVGLGPAEWFRLRWTNGNGTTATTVHRLECYKLPMASVLPDTLTPQGNLKVALMEGSVAAATEYDEGDAVAAATGGAVLFRDGAGALRAISEVNPWPILARAEARTTRATAAVNGDVRRLVTDAYGRVQVKRAPVPRAGTDGTAITSVASGNLTGPGTAGAFVDAPSAGQHLKVERVHIVNNSTTETLVHLRQGSAGTLVNPLVVGAKANISQNIEGILEFPTATALFVHTVGAGASLLCDIYAEAVAD